MIYIYEETLNLNITNKQMQYLVIDSTNHVVGSFQFRNYAKFYLNALNDQKSEYDRNGDRLNMFGNKPFRIVELKRN